MPAGRRCGYSVELGRCTCTRERGRGSAAVSGSEGQGPALRVPAVSLSLADQQASSWCQLCSRVWTENIIHQAAAHDARIPSRAFRLSSVTGLVTTGARGFSSRFFAGTQGPTGEGPVRWQEIGVTGRSAASCIMYHYTTID